MYETILADEPNLDILIERRTTLEEELAQSTEPLLPLVEERNLINVDYLFHLSEGSNAWALGDRSTWSFHKNRRELVKKDLFPLRSAIDKIKNSNAKIVKELTELQEAIDKATGEYHEYTQDQLGEATKTVKFPDNTPEWHEQRSKGIGGSDVGAILGVSPWNTRDDIFKLKTGQTHPEEKRTGSGALWRGTVWEKRIATLYARNHPEQVLVNCKSSWANNIRKHQFANLDGLLYLPGEKNPSTVLEIKTSSTPASWVDGVPSYYRSQLLWYMDAFKIEKGIVAVLIDDVDYREYDVIPRPGEMERIHRYVDKFQAEVEDFKVNPGKYMSSEFDRIARLMPQ